VESKTKNDIANAAVNNFEYHFVGYRSSDSIAIAVAIGGSRGSTSGASRIGAQCENQRMLTHLSRGKLFSATLVLRMYTELLADYPAPLARANCALETCNFRIASARPSRKSWKLTL
jgi:hypothetical protein